MLVPAIQHQSHEPTRAGLSPSCLTAPVPGSDSCFTHCSCPSLPFCCSSPAMSPSASNAPPPSRSNYHKLLKGTLQGRGRTCWAWRGTPSLSPPPRPQKATPCPGTKAAAATPSAACCTVGPLLALPELLSFPFLLSFSLLLLLLPLPAITHSVKHSSFSSSIILRGNQDGTALTPDLEILIHKKKARIFYPETKYRGRKGPQEC